MYHINIKEFSCQHVSVLGVQLSCLTPRYIGTIKLTPGSIPPFLDCQMQLEQTEYVYEQLIELALDFKSVETLFLYFISDGYLTKSDYVLNKPEIQ